MAQARESQTQEPGAGEGAASGGESSGAPESPAQEQVEREKGWMAVMLAWVAGFVDAVGYLTLLQLFTAHMSGNSVAFGAYLGQGNWGEVLRRGFPIPLFVLGVALGTIIIEIICRRGVRSTVALILALEALLLLVFLFYGSALLRQGSVPVGWQFYLLTALSVLAMGLQTATLQRVGGRIVSTTYVTGMLTHLSEDVAGYAIWLFDRLFLRRVQPSPSLQRAALLTAIWSSYACGAIIGGLTELHWSLYSLGLPLGVLAVVIIIDLIHPTSMPSGSQAQRRSLSV